MEKSILLHNALIVTSESVRKGSIAISNGKIEEVLCPDSEGLIEHDGQHIIYDEIQKFFPENRYEFNDLSGKHVMAGGIDAHVHFRDPGLTHKADFCSESRAALLGGVTSVIDMPNTKPATTSAKELSDKYSIISGKSWADFGLHIGATNSNADEIRELVCSDKAEHIAGIKVFMGSSTGNMLVDNRESLERIFSIKEKPILVHCEDEATIKANMAAAQERYGNAIPFSLHPSIRSRRACILSTINALELAIKHGTRLHLCHVSTKEEVRMVQAAKALNPNITAETSVNYLWFCDKDYDRLGSLIKCNPAIKSEEDREALVEGIINGGIDTIGTDHAPHLLEEKNRNYLNAPSGIPSIQHCFPALLTIASREGIPLERIAALLSYNAAKIFSISRKGSLEKGMDADLVIFDTEHEYTVLKDDVAYKCGWSPYIGEKLRGKVQAVYAAGRKIAEDGCIITDAPAGQQLSFNRA
ncbi:MAG: dihydroorotase [Bacteroidales bacterium]|nr:dihydroorotase [Bacteroidales bacterium]